MAKVRLIVTGEDEDGKGCIAHVEELAPLVTSNLWYGAWGWDTLPELPLDPAVPYMPQSAAPPRGGVRVTVAEFPPADDKTMLEDGGPEDLEKLNALREATDRTVSHDHETGMHKTDTIEICFVIDGEIGLEQEDGSEVTLRQGDVVIQNGAAHAWRNRKGKSCSIGYVIVGADRRE